MIHTLELELQQRPEVLERVLRVTRHRGFKVTMMNMRASNNANTRLDLEVDSEREISLLSNQLTKLVDVTQCRVLAGQSSMPVAQHQA